MDTKQLLAPEDKSPLGRSRTDVLEVLRAADGPLGVQEVAQRTGLHSNTARFHLEALTEAGLRVPDDISVIGYDDTPGAASFVPPLTSVHQYLRDGGVLLAKKMLAMIEGQPAHSEMLPTTLIVRHT